MRAFLIIWTTFAMAVIVASARADQEPDNVIPVDFEAALEHAEEAYLVSIDRPKESRGFELPKLDEYVVLGQTKLSIEDRGRLAEELRLAVKDWEGAAAGCFKPRHRLRLIHHGATYEFVVCFECSNAELYKNGKIVSMLYLGQARKHSQPFNDILKVAKIKLAP